MISQSDSIASITPPFKAEPKAGRASVDRVSACLSTLVKDPIS